MKSDTNRNLNRECSKGMDDLADDGSGTSACLAKVWKLKGGFCFE